MPRTVLGVIQASFVMQYGLCNLFEWNGQTHGCLSRLESQTSVSILSLIGTIRKVITFRSSVGISGTITGTISLHTRLAASA